MKTFLLPRGTVVKIIQALLLLVLYSPVNGAELLGNGDFESDMIDYWRFFCAYREDDAIKRTSTSRGTDLRFTINNGGTQKWEVQLLYNLAIRAGYRYTMALGGSNLGEGVKMIDFGLDHNGEMGVNNDYSVHTSVPVALSDTALTEFRRVWDNLSIDDQSARLFISGGGDTIDFSLSWVSVVETPIETSDTALRLNTVGFFTEGSKRAVVRGVGSDTFTIRGAAGAILYTGILGPPTLWPPSGETVRIADFSSVKTAGACTLYCAGGAAADFTISPRPLEAAGKAALKAFYYQRASTPLDSAFAGAWARKAGHPDTAVVVEDPSTGGHWKISSPKGWYDGVDYGKYVVSSGVAASNLLALHEHFPGYTAKCMLNIPESDNAVPDVLDEVRWNLEWMLTMQDKDGGVHAKLTPLKSDSIKMPEYIDRWARDVFMKTTPATLDFAAVMALGSRLYHPTDSVFGSRCLEAAKKAFAWADSNPSVKYVQPSDCNTAVYGDDIFTDEFFWASAELALATGNADYDYHTSNPLPAATVPTWQNVGTLGLYTILSHTDAFPSALADSCRFRVLAAADTLIGRQKTGYGVGMADGDFQPGGNGIAASQGVLLLHAYYLTGNLEYRAGAEQQMDYLLGRNCFGRCFVTGLNDRSAHNPHHPVSQADGLQAPIPGLLVGGPSTSGADIDSCNYNYVYKPANSWYDRFCSFTTNEVAIAWNAPLAYCANALEALYGGDTAVGFRAVPTWTARHRNRAAAGNVLTAVRRGNDLIIRMSMHGAAAAGARCRIYNILGKVVARPTLVAGTGGGADLGARVPLGCLAKGYVIVRIEAGATMVQRPFIVR